MPAVVTITTTASGRSRSRARMQFRPPPSTCSSTSCHGSKLLRVKGVVKIAESPEAPIVVHGVQHIFHPPTALAGWPDEDRRTRLVFITHELDPGGVRQLFDALVGKAAVDRPDRAALMDNVLVPFGGADR